MTVVDDFGKETTFHGPNHAAQSKRMTGKVLWTVIFILGLAVAFWQIAILLLAYFSDTSSLIKKEKEMAPELLDKYHYFKVCPDYWIDREKVYLAVNATPPEFTYRNLLFALSVLPSVSEAVLTDMSSWGEIEDRERIWKLERCQIGLKHIFPGEEYIYQGPNRKKRTLTDVLQAAGEGVANYAEPISSNTITVASSIMNGMAVAASDSVMNGLNGECDSYCAAKQSIDDWEREAESFYNATNGRYSTLTDFFAAVANDFNPLSAIEGSHLKWEVSGGKMCQVVQIESKRLSQGSGITHKVPLAEDIEALFHGDGFGRLGQAQMELIPYSTESEYSNGVKKIGANGGQSMVKLHPLGMLDRIVMGMITVISTYFLQIQKVVRESLCDSGQGFLRIPEGYATVKCKAACRKRYEIVSGVPDGFRTVTSHDFGDIPLDKRLAPVRFSNWTIDESAVAKCIFDEECENQHFCEEWNVQTTTEVSAKKPKEAVWNVQDCQGLLKKLLASLEIEMSIVGIGREVSFTRRQTPMDLLGTIGGILGLYVGCSIMSLVHLVVFWMWKVTNGLESDAVKEYSDY